MRGRLPVWEDEDVPEVGGGDGRTPLSCALKWRKGQILDVFDHSENT